MAFSWLFNAKKGRDFLSPYVPKEAPVLEYSKFNCHFIGDFEVVLNKRLESKGDYLEIISEVISGYEGLLSSKPLLILGFSLLSLSVKKTKDLGNTVYYKGTLDEIVKVKSNSKFPNPPRVGCNKFHFKINTDLYTGVITGSIKYSLVEKSEAEPIKAILGRLEKGGKLKFEEIRSLIPYKTTEEGTRATIDFKRREDDYDSD
ncbi:matrix protein [Cuiaba virus]|uniref:Matrix protein n=1 Tax=Cuiaba virus TaxID=2495751 RepID=A0A3Q8TNE8_9RHAB|nr:matrix protein [Cuiaba virus]AZL49342.1 matrix protein [Cuiaba virus]